MDLRWPWWPSGTYFANWNSSFNPKPNNLSFYAGFTSYVPDGPGQTPHPDALRQDGFRPGSVWTFWGSDVAGTPVRFTDVAPNLYIKNDYGGEGSSGTTGAEVWPFVQRQRWYTMLGRVWQPVGGGNHAFVGRWLKDSASGHWHLIGVARLPIPATSFTGNSGFLEPLTSEKAVRSLHRRFGYFRKAGQWRKSDTITIAKTQFVVVNTVAEDDHEYAAIEYAQRPDLLPRQLSGPVLSGDNYAEIRIMPSTAAGSALEPRCTRPQCPEMGVLQLSIIFVLRGTGSTGPSLGERFSESGEDRGLPRCVASFQDQPRRSRESFRGFHAPATGRSVRALLRTEGDAWPWYAERCAERFWFGTPTQPFSGRGAK
jgi:hypothetical protein